MAQRIRSDTLFFMIVITISVTGPEVLDTYNFVTVRRTETLEITVK